MTLLLVLEFSPTSQIENKYRFEGGELTIGRGDDADWQLDDPDKYVSRRHCVISGRDGEFQVVDSSSGGVFVDGASAPLGPGVSAVLEHGMRLRLGDFVLRVELSDKPDLPAPKMATPKKTEIPKSPVGFEDDGFFSSKPEITARTPRPDTLPDPFEGPASGDRSASFDSQNKDDAPPPLFDDPFTLDPAPTAAEAAEPHNIAPEPNLEPTPEPEPALTSPNPTPPPLESGDNDESIAALLRGLGVSDDYRICLQSPEDMEAFGLRFRRLVNGVMLMLRARAQEKQNVRVAQTVIGAQNVNPLKFMTTTDEAVAALIKARGRGYLDPDAAIEAAFSDLADHQLRTWTALQTSLRSMIDKFDPGEIEREMEADGMLETLLKGGRSSKLWQRYLDRYAEIAEAAEQKFLGEIGSEFRDAYEHNGRR